MADSKPRYIDYRPADFVDGVAGKLTPAEMGVYWLICTKIYSEGGPIANDIQELAGLFHRRTDLRVVKNALQRLIDLGKVVASGGQLSVISCLTVLQKTSNRIASARQNGRKGGRTANKNKTLTEPAGSEKKEPILNPQPSTTNQVDPSLRSGSPDEVQGAVDLLGKTVGVAPPSPGQGSRLPSDWSLPHDWEKYGLQIGLNSADVTAEAENFRDYWHARAGAGGRKANWLSTWQMWARKAKEQRYGKSPNPPPRFQRPAALSVAERRAAIAAVVSEPLAPGRAAAGDGDQDGASDVA